MLLAGETVTTIRRNIVRSSDAENSPDDAHTYTHMYARVGETRRKREGKILHTRRDCSARFSA